MYTFVTANGFPSWWKSDILKTMKKDNYFFMEPPALCLLGHLLWTSISLTRVEVMTKTSNHVHVKQCSIITHSCLIVIGGLVTFSTALNSRATVKLKHGCIITPHIDLCVRLATHVIILVNLVPLVVKIVPRCVDSVLIIKLLSVSECHGS